MNDLSRALLAGTRHIAGQHIGRVIEERVAALKAGIEQAVAESLAGARRDLTKRLNQSVHRLLSSESQELWSKALLDAMPGFCERAALFHIDGRILRLEAARNTLGRLDDVTIDSAPAFQSAIESEDTVVALRTKGEMSHPIAQWVGEGQELKFYLFPIVARNRVSSLLYADSADGDVDTDGLELLATIAGIAAQNLGSGSKTRSELVNIAPPALQPEVQDLHSKAQRFARNQAAEIRLYKSEKVKNGREERNLYASLKEEIDSARETFRRDFLSSSGAMTDYLHLELVRTLANNDVELLGPDYPGPLA